MDELSEKSQGLFVSLKGLLRTVLAIVPNRCELAIRRSRMVNQRQGSPKRLNTRVEVCLVKGPGAVFVRQIVQRP